MLTAAAAQVLAGGHAARDYQDERFSYVILRRGDRPQRTSILDIARVDAGAAEMPLHSYSPAILEVLPLDRIQLPLS